MKKRSVTIHGHATSIELDKKLGLDGVLQGLLGGGAQQQPAPANDNVAPVEQQNQGGPVEPAQEQVPQEIDPEEALKGLLKGLF